MYHLVYQVWLQKVAAHHNGQRMMDCYYTNTNRPQWRAQSLLWLGATEEIRGLALAEGTRLATLSFQVAYAISRLSRQSLLISWTLWPRPLLLQQAIAVNFNHQQQDENPEHTSSAMVRVSKSCSQLPIAESDHQGTSFNFHQWHERTEALRGEDQKNRASPTTHLATPVSPQEHASCPSFTPGLQRGEGERLRWG